MAALAEAGFGNDLGMELQLSSLSWKQLWSEAGSLFVISVHPDNDPQFKAHFPEARALGVVTQKPAMSWEFQGQRHEECLSDLRDIWSKGVLNVYQA